MQAKGSLARKLIVPIGTIFAMVFVLAAALVRFGVPATPGLSGAAWAGGEAIQIWVAVAEVGVAIWLLALLLWLWQRRIVLGQPEDAAPAETRAGGAVRVPTAPGLPTAGDDPRTERTFLYLVTVLQQEGRLIDFLAEDLSDYADEQVGAAVRRIHRDCREALEKSVTLKPVLETAEGERYTVAPGFDPAAVKLTGNVIGTPPFDGVVRHRGWRADQVRLPLFSANAGQRVLAPAEIEIS